MLSIRKKGANWFVRGTVRLGKKKEHVAEQGTGLSDESAARRFADDLERDIQARLTLGIVAKKEDAPPPFSDVVARYLLMQRPKKGDVYRVSKLLDFFAEKPVSEIDPGAWGRFCEECLPHTKPSSRARYLTTLRAAWAIGALGVAFPKIESPPDRAQIVRWLTRAEADRMIDAYAYVDPADGRRSAQAPHAQQIALFARYQGARAQEILQLQRGHIDLARGASGAAYIAKSKNGEDRWIPLHPRVRTALEPLLAEKRVTFLVGGQPLDPLFLTDKGKPYKDTRINGEGSNPFRRSHVAACKRAKITAFRFHDWRHHWATMCVRSGMDLPTLQKLGGWRELNMVQRYAAVDMEHAGERLARVQ